MNILFAFLVLSILGLLLGIALAFAEKKLKVEKDQKLIDLENIMPGANCGGCGYAGCSAYAEAVYKGEAKIGLCSPGGKALADKMGEIMGVAVGEVEKEVAFVHCDGNYDDTKTDFNYKGMDSCKAAQLLQGGPMGCKEGCLHIGSCIQVCPVKAISRKENGQIIVDKEKCIGCKACVGVCPTKVIRMVPYKAEYLVACNNHQNGAQVKKVCKVGCIGCQICVRKVEDSSFYVENFLSHNDFSKSQENAAKAAELCPQKCIVKRD